MLNFLNSRKFRQGSVATAITVIVIALIVVLNMIVSTLSGRYSLNLDLTSEKIFGITEDTKNYLNNLTKDVDIYVLSTEANFIGNGEYFVQANEVIKKYEQQSPRVQLHYIDYVRNPTYFGTRFQDLQLTASSIVVACGEKATDLTPYDLYNIENDQYYGQRIASSKAEQSMTSAILKVTSDKKVTVTIITGHNEMPLEGLRSLLAMNDFEITETNLLTEDISPDAKLAVLCAPMRDLSEDELKKLDKYLLNSNRLGTNLLYFTSVDQPTLPKLDAFLADWGIGVGEGVVFESSGDRTLQFTALMPLVEFNEDVYAKPVIERNMYMPIVFSRPLSILFDTKSSTTVSSLLQFSSTSGIVPPNAPENWQPNDSDISGPIPALILAQKTTYEGTAALRSSVIVCGSSIAVEDSFLASTSFGNGDYFLNLFNIISEREDVVEIQSKAIGGKELVIQTQQSIIIAILLIVILPLAVLIFGIVIWLRRRHR